LHGGISYALADSALAFAANAYGHQCVSIETAISHLKPCKLGDELTAEVQEIQRGKNIGRYEVKVYNQIEQLIAHFKGTVHISEKVW
jgi:acyl-CoA thioesterase